MVPSATEAPPCWDRDLLWECCDPLYPPRFCHFLQTLAPETPASAPPPSNHPQGQEPAKGLANLAGAENREKDMENSLPQIHILIQYPPSNCYWGEPQVRYHPPTRACSCFYSTPKRQNQATDNTYRNGKANLFMKRSWRVRMPHIYRK